METEIERLEFIYRHSYENVKFADQKAIFLVPINLAALGAVYWLIKDYQTYSPFLFAAGGFIALGIGLCGAVVWPRSPVPLLGARFWPKDQKTGIVDPNMIAYHRTAESFAKEFSNGKDQRFADEFFELVFKHCAIHLKKYQFLRAALISSYSGWLVIAILSFAIFICL